MTIERNQRLYRLMSEPTDQVAAKANLAAFEQDLTALREKHHIKEIVYATAQALVDEDGTEHDVYAVGSRGSSATAPLLAAVLFGEMRKLNEQILDQVAGEKKR